MKTLLTFLLLASTLFGIRDSHFITRLNKFTDNIIENEENFTKKEWKDNLSKYLEFREQYKSLSNNMSQEDKETANELFCKINAIIIKHTASKTFDSLSNIFDEATGTLRELKDLIM